MTAIVPELQYCWVFDHPIAGVCGGSTDDEWSDDRSTVERNASFCEYPHRVITRTKPKKPVSPGSVRPSIRGR